MTRRYIITLQTLCMVLLHSVSQTNSEKIAVQYIEQYGYLSESHYVTTSDGYILNLHRIPKRTPSIHGESKVVYLANGLWSCSMQWLFTGPKKSLAFLLADQGYDVWLSNDRGNEYSRNHTYLNPDTDYRFWNYSWHEIGLFDLPASIDYILVQTNKTGIYYVGHSEGATVMYVLLSMLPEYNSKIIKYIHLAPTAFLGNQKSLFFTIPAALLDMFKDIGYSIENSEVSLLIQTSKVISRICSNPAWKESCSRLIFSLSGQTENETDSSLLPDLIKLFPSGGSLKQFFHFLQEHTSGHFRQYDYGIAKNLYYYLQTAPPDYNLSKVTAPGYIIYGENDDLSDSVIDVPRLCDALGNCLEKILITVTNIGHFDFLIGKRTPNITVLKILELLSR